MPEGVGSADVAIQKDQQGLKGPKGLQLVARTVTLLEVYVHCEKQLGHSIACHELRSKSFYCELSAL